MHIKLFEFRLFRTLDVSFLKTNAKSTAGVGKITLKTRTCYYQHIRSITSNEREKLKIENMTSIFV